MRHHVVGSGTRRFICGTIAVLGIVPALTTTRAGAAVRQTRAIAVRGQPAPETGGATFSGFDEPFVNVAGDETFGASYTGGAGDGSGIFLSRGGVLSAVARSGQILGDLGTLSGEFDGPIFNLNSTVAFVNRDITGGSTTAAVFQKTLTGPLTAIAKQGDQADSATRIFDTFDDIAENNLDDVAFIATYIEGGVTKAGVFLKPSGGAIVAIVLNGDTLPDTGDGTQCGTSRASLDGPWLNDSQVVAFIAGNICGGASGVGGSVFAKRPSLPLESVLLMGSLAPGSIGGTISDIAIGRPGLNNANWLGLKLNFSGGNTGFAVATIGLGGTPSPCVVGGSAAPDTSGTFSDFDPPAINQHGKLSIESDVTGDPAVSKGIFTCQNGTVRAIALKGDPAPGTGMAYDDVLGDASLSDDGRVTFSEGGQQQQMEAVRTVLNGLPPADAPKGVFVNAFRNTGAPTASHPALIGLALLLVVLGGVRIRRRTTR